MSRIARRTAALVSILAFLLGGAAAVTAVDGGVVNAGSCCTSHK
jgi:hypothetical protein